MTDRRLWLAGLVVFLVAAAAAGLGIGVRGTYGAHAAVDEPQYLLTAVSLFEDGDLDISDERAERRWQEFADVAPPVQTEPLAGGRRISPHDPLLPLLLAVPVGVAGWVAGKLTLALLAGALAVLMLWVAVRRFGVGVRLAAVGVGIAAGSAPLAVYGQQVYPELPAALVTLAGAAAILPDDHEQMSGNAGRVGLSAHDRRAMWILVVAVAVLPWLAVKYVPVAAALAVVGGVRLARAGRLRELALAAGVLVAAAAGYLAVHRLVWGGWTVYASGDHFQGSGELGAVGFRPDYLGRGQRLVSLLVDRGFGIGAWQPAWLLLPVAAGALMARRPRGWPALAAPLLVGWLVATFVALTMHGFWWPGRQLVVVLPLAVVLVLWWLQQRGWPIRLVAAGLGVAGAVSYGWLLVAGWARELTWVSGFEGVGAPTYRLLRPLLPDYRGDGYWPGHLVWAAVLLGIAAAGWWSALRTDSGPVNDQGIRVRARTHHAAGPDPAAQ